MLRGPQTAGELRINCERLHPFSDISSVEAFLHELAEGLAGALVAELPRQAGARENRWMHLLSGAPDVQAPAAAIPIASVVEPAPTELAAIKEKVARLESEVSELKALVAKICADRA